MVILGAKKVRSNMEQLKVKGQKSRLAFRAPAGQINHAIVNNSNTYEDLRAPPGSNILFPMIRSRTPSLPA
jgi:hypothetical protein